MSSSRRSSMSSVSSQTSLQSSLDSRTALILVPDPEDTPLSPQSPFHFSDDDELEEEIASQSEQLWSSSIPPLAPVVVFLYLLSPYLKLGALLLPQWHQPLRIGLPVLFLLAALAAFTRQIWYLLAVYLRKADLEEVVLDALARGRGRETRREILRTIIRLFNGVSRILLATMYLRYSVEVLLPLFPDNLAVSYRVIVTAVLAILVLPLYAASSLASRRIIYAAWTSIAAYVLWLCFVVYSSAHGTLTGGFTLPTGSTWTGITTLAFTFTSSSTLPLFASLKGTTQPVTTSQRGSRSFIVLSAISVAVALALVLPVVVSFSRDRLQHASGLSINQWMASLNAIILVPSIPAILITSSTLRIPHAIQRFIGFSISKAILFFLVVLLSFAPEPIFSVLTDILLFMMLFGTFALPAIIHITIYEFKQPLSIIIPSTPHRRVSSDGSANSHDELLQRKERSLQKLRLWKRLAWDIGVWLLLVPICLVGFVWLGGRIIQKW
ncbi:hypothetical protein JAAARDRAFT_171126 [Jaapia argillacea MUCL 33604]|uniref:Amino acid transporter transmembrane domain-containing protein n=1 Tax=Jaapia argillacea MUCL 33604 TaxID=933084 RepID=A0A067QGH0_9AGAM|nr:hypothetical protein JAAARDRAFT_171126 [Jaapia argillacea MUCL 33604]